MFKRAAVLVAGIAIGAMTVGGVALATGVDGKAESAEGVAPIAAEAPNARLAALVSGGASAGSFTVRRQVGVAQITNPQAGVYCVKPAAGTGVKPAKAVPIVGTEYANTSGFDSFAMWNSARPSCPTGNIEVDTFDSSAEARVNPVSFTIVVP